MVKISWQLWCKKYTYILAKSLISMRSDNLFAYEAKNDSGVDKQVDENDGNMVVVRDNVSCPLLGGCV